MALLGQDWNDPQTAAIMALAGGMTQGNLGAGLLGANQAYQGAQESLLKRTDLAQNIQLRNIALQQQQQEWALQLPMLRAMADRVNGGGRVAPPSGGEMSAPAIPASSGGALGSGTFGIPMGGQPAVAGAPSQGGSPMGGSTMFPGVPDRVAFPTAAFGGFKAVLPLLSKFNEPTDLMKTLSAAGIQEGSPEWTKAMQGNIAKSNYIAPVNARPGSIIRDPLDPSRVLAFNPHIPEGGTPQFGDHGNVTGIAPLSGATSVMQAAARAKTAGEGEALPYGGVDSAGNPLPITSRTAAATQGLLGAPTAAPGATAVKPADTDRAAIYADEIAKTQDKIANPGQYMSPNDRMRDPTGAQFVARAKGDLEGLQREVAKLPQQAATGSKPAAGAIYAAPPMGAQQGAQLSQDELSQKGKALMADNGQTNTVISRLQNIKMLAPGALTGAETSRRDFFNGLLSLAGIKGATDAKTASDLVDKNSSQIVTALRMGQGGAGTDALQSLLSAANPNRHMTNEAIQDAADQLIAQQRMTQDKARLLQQHYLGRDPVSYGQKELSFDQNADPRVWQMRSMTPAQQSTYIKSLPPTVASDMLQKYQALKQLGAFQ